jgi:hypothetical protein
MASPGASSGDAEHDAPGELDRERKASVPCGEIFDGFLHLVAGARLASPIAI